MRISSCSPTERGYAEMAAEFTFETVEERDAHEPRALPQLAR
jgi:hypothetical protein